MSTNLLEKMTNEELISLVKSLSSKVETLEHQLFLFRNARFGRKSEKDAESGQMSLQFDEADDTKAEPETITYTRKKKPLGHQKPPPIFTIC